MTERAAQPRPRLPSTRRRPTGDDALGPEAATRDAVFATAWRPHLRREIYTDSLRAPVCWRRCDMASPAERERQASAGRPRSLELRSPRRWTARRSWRSWARRLPRPSLHAHRHRLLRGHRARDRRRASARTGHRRDSGGRRMEPHLGRGALIRLVAWLRGDRVCRERQAADARGALQQLPGPRGSRAFRPSPACAPHLHLSWAHAASEPLTPAMWVATLAPQ